MPLFEIEQWQECYLQKYIRYFLKNGFQSDRTEMYYAQIAYFINKNTQTKITDYLIPKNVEEKQEIKDILVETKKHARTLGFNLKLSKKTDKKISKTTPKAPPLQETKRKMKEKIMNKKV